MLLRTIRGGGHKVRIVIVQSNGMTDKSLTELDLLFEAVSYSGEFDVLSDKHVDLASSFEVTLSCRRSKICDIVNQGWV